MMHHLAWLAAPSTHNSFWNLPATLPGSSATRSRKYGGLGWPAHGHVQPDLGSIRKKPRRVERVTRKRRSRQVRTFLNFTQRDGGQTMNGNLEGHVSLKCPSRVPFKTFYRARARALASQGWVRGLGVGVCGLGCLGDERRDPKGTLPVSSCAGETTATQSPWSAPQAKAPEAARGDAHAARRDGRPAARAKPELSQNGCWSQTVANTPDRGPCQNPPGKCGCSCPSCRWRPSIY
jgi:hypothetical protein